MGESVLLQYSVTSAPTPLEEGKQGIVTIHVGYDAEDVYCQSLLIVLPVGDKEGDLFADSSNIDISLQQEDEYWIQANTYAQDESTRTILLTPSDTSIPVMTDLFIVCEGSISRHTGTYQVTVKEKSKIAAAYTQKEKKIAGNIIDKTFYFANLYAYLEGSSDKPVTRMAPDTPFYLAWESNMPLFTVYQDGEIVQNQGDTKVFIKNGIKKDTTFLIMAAGQLSRTVKQAKKGAMQYDYHYLTITTTYENHLGEKQNIPMVKDQTAIRYFTPPQDGLLMAKAAFRQEANSGYIRMSVITDTDECVEAAAIIINADGKKLLLPAHLSLPLYSGKKVQLYYEISGKMEDAEVTFDFIPIR